MSAGRPRCWNGAACACSPIRPSTRPAPASPAGASFRRRTTAYLSGDTVWYPGVGEVAARFPVRLALLFMGAARVAAVGPWHLTFTAEEGVEAARALGTAAILPVHFEGWEHFSESRPEIDRAFPAAGLAGRLRWPVAGVPTEIEG